MGVRGARGTKGRRVTKRTKWKRGANDVTRGRGGQRRRTWDKRDEVGEGDYLKEMKETKVGEGKALFCTF